MKSVLPSGLCLLVLMFSAGCSKDDQERAREQAAQARKDAEHEFSKAKKEMKEAGRDLKREAREASSEVRKQLDSANVHDDSSKAGEKLRQGAQDLSAAGREAGAKLSGAALVARVKTRLASDVGLATASSINVDSSGDVITLRGTVTSEDKKRQAEETAAQVDGVRKVVNSLRVQ
jgi:osmotically-inducible protein OsmY